MTHLFPLHNFKPNNIISNNKRRIDSIVEDTSWRECKSFQSTTSSSLVPTNEVSENIQREKNKKRKKKRKFKFRRAEDGVILLGSIRELKKLMKHKKHNSDTVYIEGTIVEGEKTNDDGEQCPFRSLPRLGLCEERLRFPDGDIILQLSGCRSEPSKNASLQTGKKKNWDNREKDEFWESGMIIGEFVKCKGVVSCEQVSAESLYRGDDEDADIFIPKGKIRIFRLKVESWSRTSNLLLPAPPLPSVPAICAPLSPITLE